MMELLRCVKTIPMPNNSSPLADQASANPATPQTALAIQVLERAMRLLDVMAAHDQPVPLKQLAQQTGLHASTAHRILNDMVVGLYDVRTACGNYQFGH